MKYILLIYEDEANFVGGKTTPSYRALVASHMALASELAAQGVLQAGSGLAFTTEAKTVRTSRGKKMLHDGPFAETREQLGGYYVIEVADMGAALAIAHRVPLGADGAIEVRPLSD